MMTYLPLINGKVTNFNTISHYLCYLQQLASEVNMPYVNVTLDVGAAMNAFKLIWNFPDQFANVIIHCEDFHFIAVIGKIVANTGFEDAIFQAGVC